MSPARREVHDRIYGIERRALGDTGPMVVSINGVVASLAVTEFAAWRTGLRAPVPYLVYPAEIGIVRENKDQPEPGCYFCGVTRRA